MKNSYDWEGIIKEVIRLVRSQDSGGVTLNDLSKKLNIPRSTLHDGLKRYKVNLFVNDYNQTNEVIGETESESPKTVQDMADQVGIDLREYRATKFETTVKTRVSRGEEETIWTTKARFQPKASGFNGFGVLPISIQLPNVPPPTIWPVDDLGDETDLVISDLHFGFEKLADGSFLTYHDEDFIQDLYALVWKFRFNRISILGDLLDLSEFSEKFLTRTGQITTTQMAIEAAGKFLATLRHFVGPETEINVVEGNHDKRLRDAFYARFPGAADLSRFGDVSTPVFSLPHLLGFDKLGINFYGNYPDSGFWRNGVFFTHGNTVGAKSGATASKIVDENGFSTVFGHVHRRELATKKVVERDGQMREIFAFCPGCACRIDGSVPGSTLASNWQQGVGLVSTFGDRLAKVESFPYVPGLGFIVRSHVVGRGAALADENCLDSKGDQNG